jgi:hypothetical protein
MRQHSLLGLTGGPGEHVDPFVHLQRIAVHGDGILAPLPQQFSQRNSDPGLADAGRPEDGEDHRKS